MSLPVALKSKSKKPWSSRRVLLLFTTLAIMLFLLWYGKTRNPTITLQMCLNDPAAFDSTLIEISAETVVTKITPTGFVIRQMGRQVPVIGQNKGIRVNEFISLLAVFHKEGWLELVRFHIAKKRRLKIVVSILPVPIVLLIFFRQYRFRFRTFEFIERH